MPIPVMNFQQEQIDPLSPLLRGAAAGQQLFSQGVKNAYLPQMSQQELQRMQLANALAQIQNKYAEPTAQAALQHQQLINQYLPEDMQTQFAQRRAQTGLTNAQTDYMPLNYAIQASNSMRANSRFGDAYQLSSALRNMPAATRDAWIAQHPEEYNDMVNTMADKASQQQANPSQNLLASVLSKYYPGIEMGGSGAAPAQPQQMQSQQGIPTEGGNMSLSPQLAQALGQQQQQPAMPQRRFTSTPEQIEQLKLASQMSANNALTTNYSRKQGEAAVKLDNWLMQSQPEYSRAIQNMSQYAGLIGKGQKGIDALQKENPQAYQDYQWFTNTFRTNIDALITQMEGTSITPAQQEQYQNMLSKSFNDLTTDPKSAVNQINRLMDTLFSISKQRVEVAQPLFKDTYSKAFGYEEPKGDYVQQAAPQYPQEKLEYTAKRYGMTIDQVKQKLGIR